MMNSRPTRKPEGRGPFRKLRRIIARVVAGKPFLITVSALAAVVCWSALVASDGTLTRQKTFANVAVTVTGEAALKSRGYIVMDDILEKVPAVKMTVEVTQANYNRVSGTAYNPHFDLSQITGEGENELSVTYYSSQLYGPVVSCEPASITVNVERYITRRVPVVLEMTGTIPEGLYLDSYKTDPTTLSVSGPQPPGHLKAVHLGQHHVQQNEIRVLRLREEQAGLAVERLERLIALALEIEFQNFHNCPLVLDDQDALFFFHGAFLLLYAAPQRLWIVIFERPPVALCPAEAYTLDLHQRPAARVSGKHVSGKIAANLFAFRRE